MHSSKREKRKKEKKRKRGKKKIVERERKICNLFSVYEKSLWNKIIVRCIEINNETRCVFHISFFLSFSLEFSFI